MVTSTLSPPRRGWFDVLDDWLKRDRFVFVGWSGILLFPNVQVEVKVENDLPLHEGDHVPKLYLESLGWLWLPPPISK